MWVEYCDHELFYDIRRLLKVFGSREEYFHLLSYTNKFFRHKENVSFFEGGGWWTMKFKPPSVLLMPPALVLKQQLAAIKQEKNERYFYANMSYGLKFVWNNEILSFQMD